MRLIVSNRSGLTWSRRPLPRTTRLVRTWPPWDWSQPEGRAIGDGRCRQRDLASNGYVALKSTSLRNGMSRSCGRSHTSRCRLLGVELDEPARFTKPPLRLHADPIWRAHTFSRQQPGFDRGRGRKQGRSGIASLLSPFDHANGWTEFSGTFSLFGTGEFFAPHRRQRRQLGCLVHAD